MKVSKRMVDKELRSSFDSLQIIAFLLSRKWGIKTMNFISGLIKGKKIEGLYNEERFIPSKNGGPDIRLRIFKALGSKEKLPALLYCHGGGYVIGNPESFSGAIKKFIDTRPCVVFAPDYRKSLEAPYPAAFNDCYDTLLWISENAESLGVFDNNFIVAGHSAGGGLAAAVTLKARDTRDFKIAFQMPIYPMLDDRQITESAMNMNVPAWNSKTNSNAWNLYLNELKKHNKEVPAYAAPARNHDYSNFPPTITFVGEYEPFMDETFNYVEALKKEGIPVAFKFFKACFHGFDITSPKAKIAVEATDFTYQAFGEFYDSYINQSVEI